MTRSGLIAFAVVSLLVFAGGVWGGMQMHQRSAVEKTLSDKGWCCIPDKARCEVSQGSQACETVGGATFNWNRADCETACLPLIRSQR